MAEPLLINLIHINQKSKRTTLKEIHFLPYLSYKLFTHIPRSKSLPRG